MSKLERIMIMLGIMSVQTFVFALMVLNPRIWYVFFIIWWLLAGLFWYQFIQARNK